MKQGNRTKPKIYLKALRIQAELLNCSEWPMEMHFAVVQAKATTVNTASWVDCADKFFKDNTMEHTNDAIDFVDNTSSYQVSMKWMALNNQRFNILTHMKKVLGPKATVYGSSSTHYTVPSTTSVLVGAAETGARNDLWSIDKYMKCDKWIEFSDAQERMPNHGFFILWWVVQQNMNDTNIGDTEVLCLNLQNTIVWRE
jgi:hypothetical protein